MPAAATPNGAEAGPNPEPLVGHLVFEWGDPAPGEPGQPIENILLSDDSGHTRQLEMSRELLAGGVFRWNGRRVEVFAAEAVNARATGEPLRVSALRLLEDSLSKETGAPLGTNPVSGSQPWVSILCKFSDVGLEPENLSFFQGMYANSPGGLDHYWREVSYDEIDVAGSTAIDWKVLPNAQGDYIPTPGSNSDSDRSALFEDCTAAADPFVDFSNGGSPFSGINMMFNDVLDCCAWGGGRFATLDGVSKVWRVTWEPPWAYANEGVIAHEMGHGFGLPHANNWDGDGNPYDSPWDVMSAATNNGVSDPTYGRLGKHVNSYHKNALGWIPEAQRLDVVAPAQHTITLDYTALATTVNYRMAVVPAAGSTWYTVEARKKIGSYEAALPGNAVILHEVNLGRSEPSWAVDADVPPANYGDNDGTMWVPGETFTDPAAGITIEVLSETPLGFVVRISSGEFNAIFDNGFESGNVLMWSDSTP